MFILGAGASRHCGGPLVSDFLNIAADLKLSHPNIDPDGHFERVFITRSRLQSVHSKADLDLNNIEALYTALELGKVIKKLPGTNDPDDIAKTIESLKALIVRTLEERILFRPDGRGRILPSNEYQQFASLIGDLSQRWELRRKVSIITFNYDIALDVALWRAGLGPNYCLDGSTEDSGQIDLLKLHGSLNWAKVAGEDRIVAAHPSDYLDGQPAFQAEMPGGMIKIPIGSMLQAFFHRFQKTNVEVQPIIVPPTWNKASYHEALSAVWSRAAECLGEADYIFVCGYSLTETDSFFRHLFALAALGPSYFGDSPYTIRMTLARSPSDSVA